MAVSTLGYAILGLLARQSLSGYDLARRLRRPIGFYWTAGHSQIYPELRRLTTANLIQASAASGGRRRREYSITRSGRSALHAWVDSLPAEYEPRDEVCLRAYSLWVLEAPRAIRFIKQIEDAHRTRLGEYEKMLAVFKKERGAELARKGTRAPAFGTYATLRRGIGYEREYLSWLRWLTRELISAGRESPGMP
ncbi:MAG TPA: PadR family transcriptional regulator [Candidatus Dormibacteraeota bacterium]|nr:PadR family transcriptional regulator [Candidatus Dormibacteraeota bacterium]